ncbi:MAG: NAD-dependent epimerase/dehydratase family protein [Gammaproteobacteria bacterium]
MNGPRSLRVLVTGARGFVGRAVVPALLGAGHRVVAAVRNGLPAGAPAGVETLVLGDLCAVPAWEPLLGGLDAVVHLAARVHRRGEPGGIDAYRRENAVLSARIARAAVATGVQRFVFMSTVKVHGEHSPPDAAGVPRPFTEADVPAPSGAYARSKWEAEQRLREIEGGGALRVAILRPPLIYGPGVGANFLALVRAVDRGLPLPLGCIGNARSLMYVANVADAVVRCVENGPARAAWLVSDGAPVSTPELIRALAAALDRPARLIPVPARVLELLARVTGRTETYLRLAGSLHVDDAAIRSALQWSPPWSRAQGLAVLARWYREGARA